ncbi:AAA family ATPase [Nocardia sp. CDC153]|uniref:AAA family ATPase n=1 Tax=Nocardia sp. CDC153 TaxID=3112167 RepID=UPI002DBC3EB6|nr:AAA family ATPase [Nocardia sp. CDC153]MEC3951698.1 AAA family ATPase [Nocardia sp. CDC153]
MNGLLVLVNGLPGAGKSTLGVGLSRALGAAFLSKDAVKEALAGCLENASEVPELGGVAMEAVWGIAGRLGGDVVVDSWWFKPRDLGFVRAGIEKAGAGRVVEVWCEIPAGVARARYVARRRPLIYRDDQRLAEDWDDWAARAEPLGVGVVLSVDTTREVDHVALAARVRAVAMGS